MRSTYQVVISTKEQFDKPILRTAREPIHKARKSETLATMPAGCCVDVAGNTTYLSQQGNRPRYLSLPQMSDKWCSQTVRDF